MKHLLHISGGMDSTYVLYHWLKANPDKTIMIHHCNLFHKRENRLIQEANSVDNILKWLSDNGLNNYVYHSSSFSYGSLPAIMVKDIQIISMFSSIILKTPQYQSIDTILLSWRKGEVNSEKINRGYRVRKMLDALEVGRHIELEFPIEFMDRKEMAANMPIELLRLCHSCRKPNDGKNCGKCKTCIELIDADIFEIVGSNNQ